MIKEPVVNVEEYPMQGENGNSIFVIGGYKFTVPQEVNNTLLGKYRNYDEDFWELEKHLQEFINSQPYTGVLTILSLVSEIIPVSFQMAKWILKTNISKRDSSFSPYSFCDTIPNKKE